MKIFTKLALAAGLVAASAAPDASAIGWPANYEGVMLQGFYWDSYSATSWKSLEQQADELSQNFSLIWVPNSAKSEGGMGYHPVYWFTNHNTPFGTEAELRSMIKTFKEKGTGMIADVIINHRAGVSNWTNFPTETWNGKTYKIGPEGICSNDEVRNQSGQATPTGAQDTGEGWDGARDLDHTNANVQENCKDYVKCLLTDFGYAGVRYDFVKGYAPQYTKIYNQANNVDFSVGEYWDGSYDAVANWINGTGKTSAAFDFPCKYQLNKAFNGGNYNLGELVWKANGTTDQPAGMIHFGYSQYAVTFVDNHDTYRDGSKFTGDVPAAYAFILCSPGTPCVFWPHWTQYKSAIKDLIAVRKANGIHNNSAVNVLRASADCYMAEVTGSKGKVVVAIGNTSQTPSGYTAADVKASGSRYKVWSKLGAGGDDPQPQPGTAPEKLYVLGNLSVGQWNPAAGVALNKNGQKFTGTVEIVEPLDKTGQPDGSGMGYFTFVTAIGTDWDTDVNSSDRYGATSNDALCTAGTPTAIQLFAAGVNASSAYSWKIATGKYNVEVDFDAMKMTMKTNGGGDDPQPQPVPGMPDNLYAVGNFSTGQWDITSPVTMTKDGNSFVADDVTVVEPLTSAGQPDGSGVGYFSFITAYGSDWDTDVNSSDRYGAVTKDAVLTVGTPADFTCFQAGVNASSAYSWKVPVGRYAIRADFATNKVTVTNYSGISDAETVTSVPAVYYNLQGQPVSAPSEGLYIVVRGSKVTKEYVR